MTRFAPTTEAEACEAVAMAAARRTPLSIVGGGTKATLGRPAQTEATLSSTGLSGVTLYEPAELVIAARSGTPLAQIEAALADNGQELAFEPMDWRVLLGTTGEPRMGGLVAANVSGPRRIKAGACRDSLIGVRFVNGRGEAVKSGGRVMKNVTGLDLVKLMAGSWGTLGVLTEVTFKVLPRAESTATLVLYGLDDARAIAALSTALGSPFDVSGAAHLSRALGAEPMTLVRVEGFGVSVAHRCRELVGLWASYGSPDVIEKSEANQLWRDVRDVTFLAEPRAAAVWRVSTAPVRGPEVTAAIPCVLDGRWYFDWGGGLIWIAVAAAAADSGAAAVRAAVATTGGQAMLARASLEQRAALDVFEPLPEPLMRLTRGIKASLDPAGILEPGRMYAGV